MTTLPANHRAALTFRGFLRAQTGRPDPVGDLARDAFAATEQCPHGCVFSSWTQLVAHLAVHDPSPAACAAARRARKEFRARGGHA